MSKLDELNEAKRNLAMQKINISRCEDEIERYTLLKTCILADMEENKKRIESLEALQTMKAAWKRFTNDAIR